MRPEDLLRRDRQSTLRACAACGKEIAKDARTCPHCGKTYTTAGGIFVAVVIALIIGGCVLVR